MGQTIMSSMKNNISLEIVLTKCDMLEPYDLMACYQKVQADIMDCLYLPEEKQRIYENIAKQRSKGFEVSHNREQEKKKEKEEIEEETLRSFSDKDHQMFIQSNRQNINTGQNENDSGNHHFDASNRNGDRSDQEKKTFQ